MLVVHQLTRILLDVDALDADPLGATLILLVEQDLDLAFANDPAKGVTAEINGDAVGAIEGADFALAFLSIWLGPEPPNEDLKSGLLGGACE